MQRGNHNIFRNEYQCFSITCIKFFPELLVVDPYIMTFHCSMTTSFPTHIVINMMLNHPKNLLFIANQFALL